MSSGAVLTAAVLAEVHTRRPDDRLADPMDRRLALACVLDRGFIAPVPGAPRDELHPLSAFSAVRPPEGWAVTLRGMLWLATWLGPVARLAADVPAAALDAAEQAARDVAAERRAAARAAAS